MDHNHYQFQFNTNFQMKILNYLNALVEKRLKLILKIG